MAERDFVFTYEDTSYRIGELTLAEAEELEDYLDISWASLRPIGLARHRFAVMAVFLKRDHTEEEANAILEGLGLYDSEALWEMIPLEEDEPDEGAAKIPERDHLFTFEGATFRVGDLKLRQAEELEQQLGVSWSGLRPLGRASHRRALMTLFLAPGHSSADVAAMGLYATEAMWARVPSDMPDEYENGVPLVAGEPSTTTS